MTKLSARCMLIEEVFGAVQSKTGEVFAPFHNRGQKIDSLKQPGEQVAVVTVGF